jgi:hypothetical protein
MTACDETWCQCFVCQCFQKTFKKNQQAATTEKDVIKNSLYTV